MRKQSLSHDDFLLLWNNADRRISKAEIDGKIDRAASFLRRAVRNRRAAYSWSGGKDSIALEFVCEAAGIRDCVFAMTDLEYPAFLQWVTDWMPHGLEVIKAGLDLEWLSKHQDMLFPQDAATAGKWFSLIQHRAQAIFADRYKLDYLILGRRREDGNFVGRNGANFYRKGRLTVISPIADWTHEDTFALIKHYRLAMPPIYDWPRGFRCGTHAWAARQWCNDVDHGYQEVFSIDPGIVYQAAEYLDSAKRFLQCVESSDSWVNDATRTRSPTAHGSPPGGGQTR